MFSSYTSNVKTNKQQLTHTFSLSERHFLRKLVNRGEAISLWDLGNSHNPIKWPNLVCVQVCGLPFTEQHNKLERKKQKTKHWMHLIHFCTVSCSMSTKLHTSPHVKKSAWIEATWIWRMKLWEHSRKNTSDIH